MAEKTDLKVKLAAASPWSKHTSEVQNRTLPAHVDARRYEYGELRDLYAESSFVVVPLYENDFQAGITTILEAMAMGKAVLVTGTIGQTDAIEDGQNGLYVAPGSVEGWRAAIERLRTDAALRTRLGRAARRWLEENATLERWALELAAAVHDTTVAALEQRIAPADTESAVTREPMESGVRERRPSATATNGKRREAVEA
ncbi:MAG: glycosyltransferase family 4 protein [Myxococcales bacterium]